MPNASPVIRNGTAESGAVDRQQERAVRGRARRTGGGDDRAQRRAGAGRPGERERGAGQHRAAAAGALHQRGRRATRATGAGRTARARTARPSTMITAPETFSAAGPVSAPCSACWPSRPSAMKMTEKLATKARLGPITRRGADLGRRHAGHRRDVAGDERQHARRQERDQPGAERHRNADARSRVHRALAQRVPPEGGSRRGAGYRRDGGSRRGVELAQARCSPPSSRPGGRFARPWPQLSPLSRTSSTASSSTPPTGQTEPILNPATGEVIAEAPLSTADRRRPRGQGRARPPGTAGRRPPPASARSRCSSSPTRSRSTPTSSPSSSPTTPASRSTPSATTRSRSWSTTCASSRAPRDAWRAAPPAST